MSYIKLRKKKSVRFLNQEDISDVPHKKPPIFFEDKVPQEQLDKYSRGAEMKSLNFKSKRFSSKIITQEDRSKFAQNQSAKAESLLTEQAGFIQLEEGEEHFRIRQKDILDCSAINTAQKSFTIRLSQFGPYTAKYTRNGQHLALAGQRGHVALMNWSTKQLCAEMNVMEHVGDICFLHNETMLAVAQKRWTYIYDNQGLELHCLKSLDCVDHLEFLPYHFLLAACSRSGFLSYLDVSLGKIVSAFPAKLGNPSAMAQNPSNAVVMLGHSKGTVSMWSPAQKDPLVKMLCHRALVQSLCVSQDGGYLATVGGDCVVRLWDLRMNYRPLRSFRQTHCGRQSLSFSQRGLLAVGGGNVVDVFEGVCCESADEPRAYLSQRFDSFVQNVSFCPFEDVLGVGFRGGFGSVIVPGAGEPNIDALELNPFRTKKQRQNTEVRMLLEKIQPDLISIDNSLLGVVGSSPRGGHTVEEVVDEVREFEPRRKTRKQSGSIGVYKRKSLVKEGKKVAAVREMRAQKRGTLPERIFKPVVYDDPLDRFT